MGLEDYGVILKSKPRKKPNLDTRIAASNVKPANTANAIAALESLGFVRQAPPAQLTAGNVRPHDGAIRLSAVLPVDDSADAAGAGQQVVVEALVRPRDTREARGVDLGSLSLRFAVCQPEGAGYRFLQIVRRLCDTLSLEVVLGDRTYDTDVFWAFRLYANEQIRNQEETWRRMFEQDTERLPIAVDDMWRHFLARHPGLHESGALAEAPGGATTRAAEQIDVEETLPPGAARAIAVERAESGRSSRGEVR